MPGQHFKDTQVANRSVSAPISGTLPLANLTTGATNSVLQGGTAPSYSVTPRVDTAYYEGRIIPADISANKDNYLPIDSGTSQSFHVVMHISVASTGAFNITGFDEGATGEPKVFTNRGTSNITLKHADTNSSVNNRIWCPNATDYVVKPKTSVYLYYSQPDNKWLVVATEASSGGTNALLDGSVHSDTVAQTVSRGSLVYGNSTPKWDELTVGSANTVLTSDGTDVSWQTNTGVGNLLTTTITLTDSQIRALSTTPITLISAQGANKVIDVIEAVTLKNCSAGAYSASMSLRFRFAGNTTDLLDSTSVDFNSTSNRIQEWLSTAGASIRTWSLPTFDPQNKAVEVSGSAAITGGNSANTVKIRVWYTVADFS